MNRSFIVAVLTVTMIIMMSASSFALTAPHNLNCDDCHGKFVGSDRAISATNSCLTCHTPQGEASRMSIQAEDMSNFFGSYTTKQPKAGSRSSHTWRAVSPSGPAGNSSKSKVEDSTNGLLAYGYNNAVPGNGVPLSNTTLCIRCHNVKNNNSGSGKPFLRVPSASDALCYECHNVRKTDTHTTGSHPVAYRAYSTAYKLNTTAFRKTPVSANANNPTANPGNYLSSGQIVCTTCHAPHYADSSSATLGNRSTANGYAQDDVAKGLKGQLQDSKGQLLRTDAVGATASAINVCSSCHKESANMNHNGKGQNVQCNHCHSAHVDYVGATPPEGELSPNLYLVRRDFSNISTNGIKLGANVKVIYNTASSLRFKRADGNGICQICHVPTPGVALHDENDTRKSDCISCHKHSNGFAAVDCSTCHGQPPITNLVGGPNGKASAEYTLDESFTAHRTHADKAYYNFACNNCHYNGTPGAYHNTKESLGTASFQNVFVDTAGSIGATAGHMNVSTDYNAATRVCSNVYCHSNGAPRLGSYSTVPTPEWTFGKGQIVGKAAECSSCHGFGPTLKTNAHEAHVSTVGIKCSVCHNATATLSGGIADRTKHANGAKDIVFATKPDNYIGLFTASFNQSNASCTNSCHGAATPVWTDKASGACGTCHAVPATSGAHTFHFTDAAGPKIGNTQTDCAICHDNVGNGKHANGQTDVKGCTPCHPANAIWTLPASVTCESCHTATASVVGAFTAPLKSLNSTVGHGQYSSATLHVVCTSCHNASANHIGAGAAEKRLLVAGNGLCETCHTTAAGKGLPEARIDLYVHGGSVNPLPHYNTPADLANIAAVRADSCAGCHDTHGTTNRMSVRTVINGLSVVYTGATPTFIETTPDINGFYHGLCQVCHTKTKYFNRNAEPVTSHASGNCLSCHVHKPKNTPFFAFAPEGGGCNGCHGYPPVKNLTGLAVAGNYSGAKFQDYSGGGGAHTVVGHIAKTAKPSEAWTNCTNCHNSDSHATGGTPAKKAFVNVNVDAKFKFSNATSIVYNPANNSCSNVSCHFRPSPNWVTGN